MLQYITENEDIRMLGKIMLSCFIAVSSLSVQNVQKQNTGSVNSSAGDDIIPSTDTYYDLMIPVTRHQTEARKQLEIVNDFRTGNDNWYWNEDNETKSWSQKTTLEWNYDLERVAIIRATECAVRFSHTAPDGGQLKYSLMKEGLTQYALYCGENISVDYVGNTEEVVTRWQETEEDYAGQGHRRNMLNENYTSFAAACVEYEGCYYWVQVFSDYNGKAATLGLDDTSGTATVKVASTVINGWDIPEKQLSGYRKRNYHLPDLQVSIINPLFPGQAEFRTILNPLEWTSQDPAVASVEDGYLKTHAYGTTAVTALAPDGTTELKYTVNVYSAVDVYHWEWAEDNSSADLTLLDKADGSLYTVPAEVESYIESEPTCTTDGKIIYTATAEFEGFTYKGTSSEWIPAFGHDYSDFRYTWNEYPFSDTDCLAEVYCTHDASHKMSECGHITTVIREEAGCENDGYYILQADFQNPLFTSQTKKYMIPAKGHAYYGDVDYQWSDDLKTVTARTVCTRDSTHVKEETVNTSYTVTAEPTCVSRGEAVYAAEFEFERFIRQEKTVDLEPLGHIPGKPVYTWADDNGHAHAEIRCERDGGMLDTQNAVTVYRIVKPATEKEEGIGEYTAEFFGQYFTVQKKQVTIPKLTPSSTPSPEPTPVPAKETVDMYRIYNPNSGEHFYTSNQKEKDALVNMYGWKYEGVGWVAPVTSGTPVYRLYNKAGGEHHYTTGIKERDALINKYGWTDEGIGWYSDDAETVKVFREYNPNAFANNHNYTPNIKEHNALLNVFGWKDEGIAWYAVSGRK